MRADHRLIHRWCAELALSCAIHGDMVAVDVSDAVDADKALLWFPWQDLMVEQELDGSAVEHLRGMVQAAAFGIGPVVWETV